ncbi:MAG: glycosyltransferase family 4 protein [Candidatus Nanoarchaeia archaeon]|jgi:hypothetical protein
MKVLLFNEFKPSITYGGIIYVINNEYKGLAKKGVKIKLISAKADLRILGEYENNRQAKRYNDFFEKNKSLAKKYDLLHTHHGNWQGVYYTRLFKILNKKLKIVASIHDSVSPFWTNETITSWIDSDAIIVSSDFLKKYLINYVKENKKLLTNVFRETVINHSHSEANKALLIKNKKLLEKNFSKGLKNLNSKIFAVYPGINPERYHFKSKDNKLLLREKLGLPKDSIIILSALRFYLSRGVLILPLIERAIKKDKYLKKLNIKILALGAEDVCLEHIKWKDKIKNCSNLITRYSVPYSKVNEYFKAADLYLSPGFLESFGVALKEAQSAGLHIIANNVEGVKDRIIMKRCDLFKHKLFNSKLTGKERDSYFTKLGTFEDKEFKKSMVKFYIESIKNHLKKGNLDNYPLSKELINIEKSLTWDNHFDNLIKIFKKISAGKE